VKNTCRIFAIAIWVALCCLVNSASGTLRPALPLSENSGKEIGFSKLDKSPLHRAFPSGGPEKSLSNSSTSVAAKTSAYKSFWAIVLASRRQILSACSQYAAVSGTLPLRFRKADLIFPFHYFW
jgi:hypothetical protein